MSPDLTAKFELLAQHPECPFSVEQLAEQANGTAVPETVLHSLTTQFNLMRDLRFIVHMAQQNGVERDAAYAYLGKWLGMVLAGLTLKDPHSRETGHTVGEAQAYLFGDAVGKYTHCRVEPNAAPVPTHTDLPTTLN